MDAVATVTNTAMSTMSSASNTTHSRRAASSLNAHGTSTSIRATTSTTSDLNTTANTEQKKTLMGDSLTVMTEFDELDGSSSSSISPLW